MNGSPKYPGFGSACNGCGLCCLNAPCPLSKKYQLWSRSGCRALRREDERYRCSALEQPALFGITEPGRALEMLVGGALGCSFRAAWSADGVRSVLKKAPVTGYFEGKRGIEMRRLSGNSHSKAAWPRTATLYQPDGSRLPVTQASPTAEPTVGAGAVPLSQFKERKAMKLPGWSWALIALAAAVVVGFVGTANAAVTQTGSVITAPGGSTTYQPNTGTITSITVPADAEMMLIGVGGFHGTANFFSVAGAFAIGANTSVSTSPAADSSTSLWQGALHCIMSPATGTQDLAWNWAGATAADDPAVIITYSFWKGVNTTGCGNAASVRDSDGVQSNGTSATSNTLTAQSGDLIVAWGTCIEVGEANQTFGWTNATSLADITISSYSDGGWATTSPTGNQTVTASAAACDETTVSAVVLVASGGGGGGGLLLRRRRN